MPCLSGFELYSRWVPSRGIRHNNFTPQSVLSSYVHPSNQFVYLKTAGNCCWAAICGTHCTLFAVVLNLCIGISDKNEVSTISIDAASIFIEPDRMAIPMKFDNVSRAKSVLHVQSFCFGHYTCCFIGFVVSVVDVVTPSSLVALPRKTIFGIPILPVKQTPDLMENVRRNRRPQIASHAEALRLKSTPQYLTTVSTVWVKRFQQNLPSS